MNNEDTVNRLSTILVVSVFSIKIFVSFFTNSFSFYAELADSTLDFIVILITRYSLKLSKKPADYDHMYGHYKINSLSGMLQAIFIIGIYLFILYSAIKTIILGDFQEIQNPYIAMAGLTLTSIIILILSRKIVHIGKKTNNKVIIGQGINFTGDLYRNLTIIVGIFISTFSFYIIDVIIASCFSLILIYQGIKLLKSSFNELLDSNELSSDTIDSLKEGIKSIENIDEISEFALKTIGNQLDVKVSIKVKNNTSFQDFNNISYRIRKVVEQNAGNFKFNTFIQYNQDAHFKFDLIDYVRACLNNLEDHFSFHNLYIDFFEDQIFLQFHIQMPHNWDLQKAHNEISLIEEDIKNKIKSNSEMDIDISKIEIISHLEPLSPPQHIHSPTKKQIELSKIEDSIREYVLKNENISFCSQLELHYEKERLDVVIVIQLPTPISLFEAHKIAENLELQITANFENVYRCIIHTEPLREE